jgi:hypothetical protein
MSETNGSTTLATEEAGVMGSGTVAGLMAFYDFLVDKGIATASAVTPLKSASRQIFETVEGTDAVEEIDVRSLDLDNYLDRFQVKAVGSGRYKPESITAYRTRFTRGLDYYATYLTTGSVPKFRLRAGGGGNRTRSSAPDPAAAAQPGAASVRVPESEETQSTTAGDLISYPFPLQSGGLATLRLPKRLEREDAERLAAFVRTLVFEPQKQLPAIARQEATEVDD